MTIKYINGFKIFAGIEASLNLYASAVGVVANNLSSYPVNLGLFPGFHRSLLFCL